MRFQPFLRHVCSFVEMLVLMIKILPYVRNLLLAFWAICGMLPLYGQQFNWALGSGESGNDAGTAVAFGSDGSVYATGNIAGKAYFGNLLVEGRGLYDVFVVKYNPSGVLQWVKTFGGPGNEKANALCFYGNQLAITGYFEDSAVFGNQVLSTSGRSDVFTASLDPNGNLLWVSEAGGPGNDVSYGIAADESGNVVICGSYENGITFNPTTSLSTNNLMGEAFVAAYNPQGQVRWAKRFAGNNTGEASGIAIAPNGDIGITGFFSGTLQYDQVSRSTPNPSYDVFIARLDSAGQLLWLQQAGGPYEDAAYDIAATPDGEWLVTGYFANTAYFGNIPLTYVNYNDVFVARYDSGGQCLWARSAGGSGLDLGIAICSDEAGNAYVTGMFDQNSYFRGYPLNGIDRDVFLASYGVGGNLRWADRASGIQTECGMGIDAQNGKIAIAGYYLYNTVMGNIPLNIADNNDLFVAMYEPTELLLSNPEVQEAEKFSLSPNPFEDQLQIHSSSNEVLELDWYSITGQWLQSQRSIGSSRLTTDNLPKGIYLLNLKEADGTPHSFKVVKR